MTWPDDDNSIGFPDRLVEAFRLAAQARVGTLAGLGELLGVDDAAAREVLVAWARAGLAAVDGDEFRLRPPDAAVAQALGDVAERMRRDLAGLAGLVAASGPLAAAWRESFENDAVDYTIDRIHDDGVAWFSWWSYIVERRGGAACAIVSNLDALAIMETAAPGLLDRTLGMLGRGEVALRLIVAPEARMGAAAAIMHRLAQAGAGVRVADSGRWFAVASDEVALVPATWGRDRDVAALLVREPSIVAGLTDLFRLRWQTASPWGGARFAAAADPVIEALCEGRTDGDVADRFGMSVRSVRRRVAAALAETGSTSRMELGYRLAASRGAA